MKTRAVIFFGILILSIASNASVVKVKVKGMVCGFCAEGIHKKFSTQASVKKVDVDIENQLVTLTLANNQDLKDEKIFDLVRDAGFTPTEVQR